MSVEFHFRPIRHTRVVIREEREVLRCVALVGNLDLSLQCVRAATTFSPNLCTQHAALLKEHG